MMLFVFGNTSREINGSLSFKYRMGKEKCFDNLIPFLEKSHCTIHPTYYPEGMSNVLLESAASGRPIITTNRSGCKEILEDGINGYFVKEKDYKDLVKKIDKFIKLSNKEKKQMGINGRNKIEKEFDRNIIIDEYMKVISGDN